MTHDLTCGCKVCLATQMISNVPPSALLRSRVVFPGRVWAVPGQNRSIMPDIIELTRLIEAENRERRAFHAFMQRVLAPLA